MDLQINFDPAVSGLYSGPVVLAFEQGGTSSELSWSVRGEGQLVEVTDSKGARIEPFHPYDFGTTLVGAPTTNTFWVTNRTAEIISLPSTIALPAALAWRKDFRRVG